MVNLRGDLPSYSPKFSQFLPAATKLGQGNKFTGVCLPTRGGWGTCSGPGGCTWSGPGGMPGTPPQTRYTPPGPGAPPRPGPPDQTPPGPGTPPRPDTPPGPHTPSGDSGIRSTSGRYASYWNAFLYGFFFFFWKICQNCIFDTLLQSRRSLLRGILESVPDMYEGSKGHSSCQGQGHPLLLRKPLP